MSKKFTELAGLSTETVDWNDLFAVSVNPDGSPISRKVEARYVLGLSGLVGGRLTLESGVPVSASDQTAKTSVYWTPFVSGLLPLFGPSASDVPSWALWELPEFAGALGTLTDATNYDVTLSTKVLTPSSTDTGADTVTFGAAHGLLTGAYVKVTTTAGGLTAGTSYWFNASSSTAGSFHTTLANALAGSSKVDLTSNVTQSIRFFTFKYTAWTNDTARATALARQAGASLYALSGSPHELVVGTIRTTSTTTTADSGGGASSQTGGKRFVWNMYSRVRRFARVIDTTNSWTTASGWRQANNAAGNKVEYVCGLAGAGSVDAGAALHVRASAGSAQQLGIGIDSTSAPSALYAHAYGTDFTLYARYSGPMLLGYHYVAWLENAQNTSGTNYGDTNPSGQQLQQSGLDLVVEG